MSKKNAFAGFLLLGVGAYFLLRQLRVPLFVDFYSWPTLLIIIGAALLLHAYLAKDHKNLFAGYTLLGLGVHFHGLRHYTFWTDSWGAYPLLVGAALLLAALKTKKGYIWAILLLALGIFAIAAPAQPAWFGWLDRIAGVIRDFWPVLLILAGAYLLFRKK
ncbi:LiaI-LiaF-like domain-containing protein [Terribacillus sp. DMT04]|uniref:LiaI-LiaF-like domain-containing protein n=1 Tax=Terribacillus sp. DMT04 TaxID=2850441 RepID=UPI001C2C4F9E|nr:DUF5668 domain-containing protein [Terribacillus sp. DMT04]QXE00590.1 hypothetical protein KS242_11215 [Terribacillus sp. DMT04]